MRWGSPRRSSLTWGSLVRHPSVGGPGLVPGTPPVHPLEQKVMTLGVSRHPCSKQAPALLPTCRPPFTCCLVSGDFCSFLPTQQGISKRVSSQYFTGNVQLLSEALFILYLFDDCVSFCLFYFCLSSLVCPHFHSARNLGGTDAWLWCVSLHVLKSVQSVQCGLYRCGLNFTRASACGVTYLFTRPTRTPVRRHGLEPSPGWAPL